MGILTHMSIPGKICKLTDKNVNIYFASNRLIGQFTKQGGWDGYLDANSISRINYHARFKRIHSI